MVLPLSQIREFPGVQEVVRDMLAVLLPEIPVVALYHELDHRLLGDWLLMMEGDPDVGPYLDNLELVSGEIFSIWARDFTPVFAQGSEGNLVAVDASFLATRRLMDMLQTAKGEFGEVSQRVAMQAATQELKGMRGSDAVPAVLSAFLTGRWQYPVDLSRPSLYLLGGDFLPVDATSALVSTLTLAENGGRVGRLAEIFRDYYGVEKAVYLENLPGDTIEHLDFIVQPINGNTILAAAAPEPFGEDRAFHRYLERELGDRLRRNRAVLEREFPDHRIIDLPMPPPLLDSEEMVVAELFTHCVERVAQSRRLPFHPQNSQGLTLNPATMDARLVEAVRAELGIRDWQSHAARRSGVEFYLGRPVEELVARHVEEHVYYRSYINSLYLRTESGAELVMVPRYQPVNSSEAALLQRLESEVKAAYKKALPDAGFHWIDSTALTEFLGAVHCLTATIPVPAVEDARGKEASEESTSPGAPGERQG